MGARPVVLVAAAGLALMAACTSSAPATQPRQKTHVASPAPDRTSSTPPRSRAPRTQHPASRPPTSHPRLHTRTSKPKPRAAELPLQLPTGSAQQVITVVAGAESDTQGTVRAWQRVPGGWKAESPALPAWLGSDGMTSHPSESLSAVPMGSFTLTQAFGHDPNPGTDLPYRQTTPSDWWVSEPGSDYNTEQHCSGSCSFTQGSPNEHLYYETPYYDYAVVIDYNTRNSPTGVRQGAGSAFFLHVSVGSPTQGCVAIDQDQLVRILRWLSPSEHPRILIGTSAH